jgi:hypothetical protein
MNSAANSDSNTVLAAYYHFVCREESCDAIRTSALLAYMDVFRIIIIIITIIIIIIIIITLCISLFALESTQIAQ